MTSPATIRELHAEMRTVFSEFQTDVLARIEEIKKGGAATGETEQKLDRMGKRLDELDVLMRRPLQAQGDESYQEAMEKKSRKSAFTKALKYSINSLSADERKLVQLAGPEDTKALSLGDDTLGGYLAPPEYVNDIIKTILQYSPIRSFAAVQQTTRHSIIVPTRTGTFAAAWVGETAQRSETTGLKYGHKEITTNELYAEVLISNQMLEDAAFDMDAQITMEAALQFQIAEGKAFVNGTAVGQPEGFMTNTSITSYVTGSASALTYAGMVTFVHALKTPYAVNATWFANRQTIGAVRNLVDSQNRPLWEPGMAPGNPPTIIGYPYAEVVDMPAIGASTYPMAFGDWKRAYQIVDRVQVVVQRLVEKYAETGQVAYLVRKRVGGLVTLPEAIIKLQCHT